MGRIKACKLLSYVHVSSIILQKHSHKQEKIYICTCMLTHRPFVLGEKKFKLNALQTRKEYSHTMTVLCGPHPLPPPPDACSAHMALQLDLQSALPTAGHARGHP